MLNKVENTLEQELEHHEHHILYVGFLETDGRADGLVACSLTVVLHFRHAKYYQPCSLWILLIFAYTRVVYCSVTKNRINNVIKNDNIILFII